MTKKKTEVPTEPTVDDKAIVVNGNCENGIKIENNVIFDDVTIDVIRKLASATITNAQAVSDNAMAIQKITGLFENNTPFHINSIAVSGSSIDTGVKLNAE